MSRPQTMTLVLGQNSCAFSCDNNTPYPGRDPSMECESRAIQHGVGSSSTVFRLTNALDSASCKSEGLSARCSRLLVAKQNLVTDLLACHPLGVSTHRNDPKGPNEEVSEAIRQQHRLLVRCRPPLRYASVQNRLELEHGLSWHALADVALTAFCIACKVSDLRSMRAQKI